MNLFVDAAFESLNKSGEELCGDKVEFVRTGNSFLAVLADGLGSGVKANILATLTSKIIATMLSKGAQLDEAVETIASTLPVCSERGIAYSTFSIISVKHDGTVYTAEFDNPSLVYCKGKKLMQTNSQLLEMYGKKIYVSNFKADENDLLICFSDGVVHAGVGRLLDLGWQYDNIVNYLSENITDDISPRLICRKLLSAVSALYMGKCGDDSTVCALRLKPSKPVTVMVGPPINAESDSAVVSKLINADGIKVICGGTTSQIVSRITGRELKVELNYENPAIPPIASMQGIDLITEGVITLGKTLELMRSYTAAESDEWDSFSLYKKDAAARLAKLLLEDSTEISFLVGRALNPAHQNPGMPVSLGLKLNLIKDLTKEIEKTGKKVNVEYY